MITREEALLKQRRITAEFKPQVKLKKEAPLRGLPGSTRLNMEINVLEQYVGHIQQNIAGKKIKFTDKRLIGGFSQKKNVTIPVVEQKF